MEWSDRMNGAISYIEDNLASEVDFNKAAEKACCSLFHFQRMFFAIIGVTPAEYTRRRRLTLAAREFTTSGDKVIDVAMKYGYDSPAPFGISTVLIPRQRVPRELNWRRSHASPFT